MEDKTNVVLEIKSQIFFLKFKVRERQFEVCKIDHIIPNEDIIAYFAPFNHSFCKFPACLDAALGGIRIALRARKSAHIDAKIRRAFHVFRRIFHPLIGKR